MMECLGLCTSKILAILMITYMNLIFSKTLCKPTFRDINDYVHEPDIF